MSAVPFPNVAPSGRRYTPGDFPQTEFKSQNGTLTILRYGNRRVDSTLSLEFRNITDENAALILENYELVNKTLNHVTFTEATGAAGASGALVGYLRETNGSKLQWRYAQPPQVTSVFKGRSTVQCEFVGSLIG